MSATAEIRWHGRGGQGVVTVSQILAQAALYEDKYFQAFPEFGPERAGAPLRGFTRVSDHPIEIHSQIYTPDIVVVVDSTLLKTIKVTEGLPKGGTLIVNSGERPENLKKDIGITDINVYTVDATRIALDVIGAQFYNVPMLGALVKVSGVVSLDSALKAVSTRFSGEIARRNMVALKRAFEEVRGE